MQLNADFSQRALVHGAQIPWRPSPMAGVERRMLDRVGEEVARATTIVRYAPGSKFSPHVHGGGEEFLVLEGVFEDEHGAYGPGFYVRNPPQSKHTPGSGPGCVILVKLRQFQAEDRQHVRLDTQNMGAQADPKCEGVERIELYADAHEQVCIEHWAAGTKVELELAGGAELFVLQGQVRAGADELGPWSWLRLPAGSRVEASAGPEGARMWIKRGHLSGPISAPRPA